ncbi:MAG: hypothetical protein ABSH13_14510 [Candidatus Acidiferrum sp.]|jgi:hypothetical protein
MSNPNERSSAVAAAGVIAIIGSVLCVLGVLFGLVGLLLARNLPAAPQAVFPVRTVAAAMMVFFLGVAVFGIFTGAGLIRFKNWARISALVWAGITAPLSAFTLLVFALVPIPTPPNAPFNMTLYVGVFAALFYGMPFAIAIWWLILLNRKTIAAQFKATGIASDPTSPSDPAAALLPQARPDVPIPITVLACFLLFSSLSLGLIVLMHLPAVLFGFAIRGAAGTAVYAIWCLLFAIAGAGLFKRIPWSYSLAIGLQVFGIVSGIVTLFSPSYEAIMREAMGSMNLPPTDAYQMPWMAHIREFSSISLVVPLIILGILVYYRARFLEASATTVRP